MPLEIEPMTSAPSRADQAEPRPPNRLVPPMTAAAMALSSRSLPPDDWLTASRREAARMPPTAAIVEHSVNTVTRMPSTEMPARRAASALPPTAKRWRPNRVRRGEHVEQHDEADEDHGGQRQAAVATRT